SRPSRGRWPIHPRAPRCGARWRRISSMSPGRRLPAAPRRFTRPCSLNRLARSAHAFALPLERGPCTPTSEAAPNGPPCESREMPAVSVIMPAYRAERYLHSAVESVLRQSFSDLELIIVDDGSSDRTVEIARRYEQRDPRVLVIEQANAGPGPARNAGFRVATGRLFAFLDSDDEWDETFLEEQIAMLDARPDVDVVFGNARNRGGPRDGQPSRPIRGEGRPIALAEILGDETSLFIMAVFRREAVDAIGGFDPALLTNEE